MPYFKDKTFSPTWFATLLLLVVVAGTVRLGIWQYDRAQEKNALQENFDQKLSAPRVRLVNEIIHSLASYRYQSISVTGSYIDQFQFVLDNQPRGLVSGYNVITPMKTNLGIILVNRGWVERSIDRAVLPNTSISEHERIVQGKINLPGEAFGLGDMTLESGWPRRIQYIDYASIKALLYEYGISANVLPFVLMLEQGQKDAYQLDWKPLPEGAEKHYAYMVQWFAMAFTACIIYFILAFKSRINNGSEKEEGFYE